MLRIRLISIFALAALLGGCASDGNRLDAGLGNLGGLGSINLGGGGAATASLPSTDSYVKQQLERRGL